MYGVRRMKCKICKDFEAVEDGLCYNCLKEECEKGYQYGYGYK